jgi:hypothetical protein
LPWWSLTHSLNEPRAWTTLSGIQALDAGVSGRLLGSDKRGPLKSPRDFRQHWNSQTWFEKVSIVGGCAIGVVILLLILRILMTFFLL